MKKNLLSVFLCLLCFSSIYTQTAKQKVVVEKMNGDRLSGYFNGATEKSVDIELSGSVVKIPVSEISVIKFNEAPESTTGNSTKLQFEAAVIYKIGGVQPVARAEFYLLDKSVETILSEAGLKPRDNVGLMATLGLAIRYPEQSGDFLQTALPAIKSHIKSSVTSDFNGKGEFSNIIAGDYWFYGVSNTRKGFIIWDVPVKVSPGVNSVTLDQNNAAVAF